MTPDYTRALQDFVTLLQRDQKQHLKEAGVDNWDTLYVSYESGRKYDKIKIHHNSTEAVKYFIDRKTGDIYGKKSPQAPKLEWWFGDIWNADKWVWGDDHGRPVSDTRVRAVKRYKGYIHYIKV